MSSTDAPAMENTPACLTSTRYRVASPCFASSVMVSSTSRTSGANSSAEVFMLS